MTKQSPAKLLRRIALLEAQCEDLQSKLTKAYAGWSDLCMARIVAEERCKNALAILRGDDE